MFMNLNTYTTLSEIAQRERINYHTLRKWKMKARVKETRVGTVMLIKKTDVSRILRAGRRA